MDPHQQKYIDKLETQRCQICEECTT